MNTFGSLDFVYYRKSAYLFVRLVVFFCSIEWCKHSFHENDESYITIKSIPNQFTKWKTFGFMCSFPPEKLKTFAWKRERERENRVIWWVNDERIPPAKRCVKYEHYYRLWTILTTTTIKRSKTNFPAWRLIVKGNKNRTNRKFVFDSSPGQPTFLNFPIKILFCWLFSIR